MAEDTTVHKSEPPKSEEYRRFESLARGLFAVPKAELDAQMKKTAKVKDKPQADFK